MSINPINFNSRRKIKTTIAILVSFALIIFVLMVTLGFKLLLNASVFIAGLTAKNQPVPAITKNQDLYGSVTVDTIPSATNSAQIALTGTVVNYDTLKFYINGTVVKTLNTYNTNNYSVTIGDLQVGDNQVYVTASTSDGKNNKTTETFPVNYKNQPPSLDVSTPSDNSTVNTDSVQVQGTTDSETLVKVNDLPVVVDATGHFTTSVSLNQGQNQITIVAEDDAGNSAAKTITVTYNKSQ